MNRSLPLSGRSREWAWAVFFGELFAQFGLVLFGNPALHHPSLWVATELVKI